METNEKNNVMEPFPGMSVEEIRALYFAKDALVEPAYKVYQLNWDGYRYYYRFNEAGEPEFYPSVTTLLSNTMPTPPALLDWMISNGKEGATEKRDLAAAYGTMMHGQFESLIINRTYDFDDVPAIVGAYMERENLPEKVYNEWCIRIRKDVLAFAQFVRDYNVKPLAVEIGLVHPDYHFAGCIDLPCIMMDPKSGEKYAAIVDFKSGKKGFWEEHELQLHLYRMMWNVNYPNMPIARLFNFAPKDWRTKPTYNLKDQTDSPNAAKMPYLLGLAGIEDEKRDNTLTIIRGQLDLDKGKIADNILTLSLSELIKSKTESADAPEQAANVPEITQEEIKVAEKALGIPVDVPDMPKKGRKRAVKSVETSETINVSSEPQKSVKSKISENLPENDLFPWERDMKEGTGIEVKKAESTVEVTARFFEAAPALLNDEIEL